jgi:hypothetical protein
VTLRGDETMPDEGAELLRTLKGIGKFYDSLAQLLKAAESLMQERGYSSTGYRNCLYDGSTSIDFGWKWIPRDLVRTYHKAASPNEIAMVCVLLDDKEREYTLAEPIVACASFGFPIATPNLEPRNSQVIAKLNPSLDGSQVVFDSNHPRWGDDLGKGSAWNRVRFVALPLVEITDHTRLLEGLIIPFMELVQERAPATT